MFFAAKKDRAKKRYVINESWSIEVTPDLTHRVDRDRLVLARPGLSLHIQSFWHDSASSLEERSSVLQWRVPQDAFDAIEEAESGVRRFGYRLPASESECATFHGVATGKLGHVEVEAVFQHESELETALETWRSLRESSVPER